MLTDEQLERYSRQLMLPEFSLEQQESLRKACVVVVGCGGLGNPLSVYLAAAGVGELRLIDGDHVARSNLHRQILFRDQDLGRPKAAVAAATIQSQFPDCSVSYLRRHLDADTVAAALEDAELVADCSDNYPIRYALNRACLEAGIPLVSAAAVRLEGQLATFHPRLGGPCYRCLYPDEGASAALSCRDSGVMGPVVGTLGTLQALEVIKNLCGMDNHLRDRLLVLDLAVYSQRVLSISRRDDCPDCGERR